MEHNVKSHPNMLPSATQWHKFSYTVWLACELYITDLIFNLVTLEASSKFFNCKFCLVAV